VGAHSAPPYRCSWILGVLLLRKRKGKETGGKSKGGKENIKR